MRAAAAGDDPAALLRPAHTLKSSSANVGALALAEQCRTLEADARTRHVPDMAVPTACEAVRGTLAQREGASRPSARGRAGEAPRGGQAAASVRRRVGRRRP